MSIYCNFRTPMEACYALGSVTDRAVGKKMARRPYNFHNPENTSWWLVPSGEWPAFKYGKYYFIGDKLSGDLFAGLYIEKGHGIEAKGFYGREWYIDQSWAWHELLSGLRGTTMQKAIQEASGNLAMPVELIIDGGPTIPKGDEGRGFSDSTFDEYRFAINRDGTLHQGMVTKRLQNPLKVLDKVSTYENLLMALEELAKQPLIWVDFFVAIRLRIENESKEENKNVEIWNAEQVWSKFLSYFVSWVR